MAYPFKYDRATAIEALLYVAERVDEPTLHKAFKLMYFADREHLEEYGRLIFGDRYVAMKNGPVPSHTYDITKCVRGDHDDPDLYAQIEGDFDVVDQYRIVPKRGAHLEMLSQSEREALDHAIAKYGRKPFGYLTQISHDASWRRADENGMIDLQALTLGMRDREAILEHVANPHPDVEDIEAPW